MCGAGGEDAVEAKEALETGSDSIRHVPDHPGSAAMGGSAGRDEGQWNNIGVESGWNLLVLKLISDLSHHLCSLASEGSQGLFPPSLSPALLPSLPLFLSPSPYLFAK